MPFSPEEIAGKHFVVTFRGYDRSEVDAYLRALASDQARLLKRIADLESAPPQPGGDGERSADASPDQLADLIDETVRALDVLRRALPGPAQPGHAGTTGGWAPAG